MEQLITEKNLYQETIRSIREQYCTNNQCRDTGTIPVSTLADQYPGDGELNFNH